MIRNIKKILTWFSLLLLVPFLGTLSYASQTKNITRLSYLNKIKQGSLFIQNALKDVSLDEFKTYLPIQKQKHYSTLASGFDLQQKQSSYFMALKQGSFTLNDLVKMAHEHGYSYKQQAFDLEKITNNQKYQQIFKQDLDKVSIQQQLFVAERKQDSKQVSYYLEQIRFAGIKAGIAAGAAAAVAAGYWAAAFFSFGATVASAAAATAQAVLFGVEGGIYGATYEKYKNNSTYLAVKNILVSDPKELAKSQKIFTAARRVIGLFKLFKDAYQKIKTATVAITTGVGATSWAAPTGLAFLVVADIVLSIVDIVLSLV